MVILLSTEEAIKYSQMSIDGRRLLGDRLLGAAFLLNSYTYTMQTENKADSHLLETPPVST